MDVGHTFHEVYKMKTTITEMVSKTTNVYNCDFCGKQMKYFGKCHVCNRDLCDDCNVTRESCGDDYSYCPVCFTLGGEYRGVYEELTTKIFEKKDEWIKSCKEYADKKVTIIPGSEAIKGEFVTGDW